MVCSYDKVKPSRKKLEAESTSNGTMAAKLGSKVVHFLRHGQAMHNPRAEASRAAGGTYDEFLQVQSIESTERVEAEPWLEQLMKEDDAFDAPLTHLGREQALDRALQTDSSTIDLIVSSPLSRALDTGPAPHNTRQIWMTSIGLCCPVDLVCTSAPEGLRKVSIEHFREINGLFLNAKRRSRTELTRIYRTWNFDELLSKYFTTSFASGERVIYNHVQVMKTRCGT